MNKPLQLKTLANRQQAQEQLLAELLANAAEAIAQRGRFVMILAGGNTPKPLYQALAQRAEDWQHWHLIYGDERYQPLDNPQRNHLMVEGAWLNNVNFPRENHHIMPFSGNIEDDVANYSKSIAHLLPADVALLGIGEDGHTASLFIDTPQSSSIAQAIDNAPKPPAKRISLSHKTLSQSQSVFFLAHGQEKLQIIKQGIADNNLPFSQIQAQQQRCIFYSD